METFKESLKLLKCNRTTFPTDIKKVLNAHMGGSDEHNGRRVTKSCGQEVAPGTQLGEGRLPQPGGCVEIGLGRRGDDPSDPTAGQKTEE